MAATRSFSNKSMIQYNTLHPDLQKILDVGIVRCLVDFSLIEGHRPPEKQFEYYKKGRTFVEGKDWIVTNKKQVITNVDGYKKKGKHNYNPSLAVDIAVYVPGKPQLTYDSIHLTYVAATLMCIAEELYEKGLITHKLTWGRDWDRDGDLSDNKLFDEPHLQLYKP
jgi:peptidoglycan L-alanyl-D-glutamate endopeptidase CwlK